MAASRRIVASTMVACALAIVACDRDDGSEATDTTAASSNENLAVVWASSVDANRVNTDLPRPRWVVGETTVSLDIVGIVANDPTAEEFGAPCQEWVELLNTDDERCMVVQFRFDVSASATERGGIFIQHLITAEGEQIDLLFSNTAWPDTVDNFLVFVVPGAGPGSTIVFSVNDGLGLAIDNVVRDIEFVTPDVAEWKPVDFLDD